MSQVTDCKENTNVQVLMNKMNISANDGQAQGGAKVRQQQQDQKKKQRQAGGGVSRSAKSSKAENTSQSNEANASSKPEFTSSRLLSSKARQSANRKVPNPQQQQHSVFKASKQNNQTPNEYKIIINSNDMEICRQTATHLFQIRESVRPDPALQSHLAMLQFNITHFMLDQQRKALYHQEHVRQLEIAKWLSTKSEEEQREYLERQQSSFR